MSTSWLNEDNSYMSLAEQMHVLLKGGFNVPLPLH